MDSTDPTVWVVTDIYEDELIEMSAFFHHRDAKHRLQEILRTDPGFEGANRSPTMKGPTPACWRR